MALGDYSVGSRGTGVSDLQKYLREIGYNITIDGIFGNETKAAVLSFQRARGIRADGIVGPETLIELSKARAIGWRAPVSVATPTTPRTEMPAMDISVPTPSIVGSKMTGLVILVAIAVGVWIFTNRKTSEA